MPETGGLGGAHMVTSSALFPPPAGAAVGADFVLHLAERADRWALHWLTVGRPVGASMTRPPLSASELLPLLSLRRLLAELDLVKAGRV